MLIDVIASLLAIVGCFFGFYFLFIIFIYPLVNWFLKRDYEKIMKKKYGEDWKILFPEKSKI